MTTEKIQNTENPARDYSRLKKSYAEASAVISKNLGKDGTHEDYFNLMLLMARGICSGNNHLSQAEALHNAQIFSEQLQALVVMTPAPKAFNQAKRLM